MRAPHKLFGVVISAGKMMRAVKVRTTKEVYDPYFRKLFHRVQLLLVADPNSSLRQGDTVRFARCKAVSGHIKHVVEEILAPWGPAIGERPPVLNEAERLKLYRQRQERKLEKKMRPEKAGKEERKALA